MPRLVRIAITLLAAATMLVFLVRQRALELEDDLASGLTEAAITDETRMIVLGTVIAGALVFVGITLVIITLVNTRKKSPRRDG